MNFSDRIDAELAEIDVAGLFKRERVIVSSQSTEISLVDGTQVLNFCANNYLGLSDNLEVIQAAKAKILSLVCPGKCQLSRMPKCFATK